MVVMTVMLVMMVMLAMIMMVMMILMMKMMTLVMKMLLVMMMLVMLMLFMHTATVIWHMSSKSCGPGPISRATREKVVSACNHHCICLVFVFLYVCCLI